MERVALQKTLIYYRGDGGAPFFHEANDRWLELFQREIQGSFPALRVETGYANEKTFFIAILFPSLRWEAPFSQNFYVEGRIKALFKESMLHSKRNRIAFSMSNINLDRLPSYERSFLGYRVMTCDIKPSPGTRFFDAPPEKRKTVPLLYEILGLPQTLSCSGYYDFDDNVKHVQTIYTAPDESVLDQVRALLAKYPEHGHIRDEYNRLHQITCLRQRGPREVLPFRHYLEEIQDRIPEDLWAGLDTRLFF